MLLRSTIAIPLSLLMVSCVQSPVYIKPSPFTDTPDLSGYKNASLSSNSTGERTVYTSTFYKENANFVLFSKEGLQSNLILEPNRCRNEDPSCIRRFSITGDISVKPELIVKCFVEIRNDVNAGYENQPITGLCRDKNSRNYSVVFSK